MSRCVTKDLLSFPSVSGCDSGRNNAAFRYDAGLRRVSSGRVGGAGGSRFIVRLNRVDLGRGHKLDVPSQVALLNRDHLAATTFTALAFAFYVACIFVGLTAAGLPRLDLRVGGRNACNSQQAGNRDSSSKKYIFQHSPLSSFSWFFVMCEWEDAANLSTHNRTRKLENKRVKPSTDYTDTLNMSA